MKKSIALGFALSMLAISSAFASPQASSAGQTIVLEPIYIHATATVTKVAGKDNRGVSASPSSTAVIVADNRQAFGSQYQRY